MAVAGSAVSRVPGPRTIDNEDWSPEGRASLDLTNSRFRAMPSGHLPAAVVRPSTRRMHAKAQISQNNQWFTVYREWLVHSTDLWPTCYSEHGLEGSGQSGRPGLSVASAPASVDCLEKDSGAKTTIQCVETAKVSSKKVVSGHLQEFCYVESPVLDRNIGGLSGCLVI